VARWRSRTRRGVARRTSDPSASSLRRV
jgi:hypothetical protein